MISSEEYDYLIRLLSQFEPLLELSFLIRIIEISGKSPETVVTWRFGEKSHFRSVVYLFINLQSLMDCFQLRSVVVISIFGLNLHCRAFTGVHVFFKKVSHEEESSLVWTLIYKYTIHKSVSDISVENTLANFRSHF